MKYKNKKHRIIRRYIYLGVLIICLLASAVITNGALAKYIKDLPSAYKQAEAAEFYFYTRPATNTPYNPYAFYNDSFDFEVSNYDAFNTAEKDITYTVEITKQPANSTAEIQIDGVKTNTGRLAKAPNQSSNTVFIGIDEDGDYTVEVKATAPFTKTITLYFRANTHYADSFYTVTTHTGWMELDVYTGSDNNNIQVNYGSLQPDNTLALTSRWLAGTNMSGTLTGITAYSHYKLIFFGSNVNDISLNQSGKRLNSQRKDDSHET